MQLQSCTILGNMRSASCSTGKSKYDCESLYQKYTSDTIKLALYPDVVSHTCDTALRLQMLVMSTYILSPHSIWCQSNVREEIGGKNCNLVNLHRG